MPQPRPRRRERWSRMNREGGTHTVAAFLFSRRNSHSFNTRTLIFFWNTTPLTGFIEEHSIRHAMFTDGTQPDHSGSPGNYSDLVHFTSTMCLAAWRTLLLCSGYVFPLSESVPGIFVVKVGVLGRKTTRKRNKRTSNKELLIALDLFVAVFLSRDFDFCVQGIYW